MNLTITHGDTAKFTIAVQLNGVVYDLTSIQSFSVRMYNALTGTTIVQSTLDGSIVAEIPATNGTLLWTCQPAVTNTLPNQDLIFTARCLLVDSLGGEITTDSGPVTVLFAP